MSIKNKALKQDGFKQGKMSVNFKGWDIDLKKDPLLFANSSELAKIQNRNRKNRNK